MPKLSKIPGNSRKMASIDLYLIRHGIAADRLDYSTDEDRPLTNEGKKKTQKIATHLHDEFNLQFDLILTSPLVRAKQTAEILQKANLATKIEESPHLAPAGDIQTWLDWLDKWQQTGSNSLALVGHQPNLGNWAETLTWGKPRGALVVKKAGIIGLTTPETGSPLGCSVMFWLTPPKFLLPQPPKTKS